MANIDLNERRKHTEAPVVAVGERSYTLPVVLPASVMGAMMGLSGAATDPDAAVRGLRQVFALLFGEGDADSAMDAISLDELSAILTEAYGIAVPQSSASPRS